MFEEILWVVLGFAPTLAALQAADKMRAMANDKKDRPIVVEA